MLQPTGDPAIASGYSDHVEAAALLNDGTLWTRSFDRPKRFLSQDYRWDRRTDLVFFRPSDNKWYVATANVDPGTGETGVTKHVPGTYDNFGVSTDRFVAADYDGDGQTDYALFRPSTGKWYVRLANGSGDTVYPTTGTFGDSTDTMVPGDYNGDGRADYAYFHPADRVWHVALSSSGATSTMQFGNTGDIPVPGDYTGDGTTDYAVFRPSAGKWFVRPREGLGFDIVYPPTGTFGGSTDRLVPADYDGDGRTDYAYYRISDKKWVSASSRTGAVVTLPQFGETSDRFVPADYDFDGKADQALYRPSTGTWYVRRSNGGNDIAAALGGTAADIVPYAR